MTEIIHIIVPGNKYMDYTFINNITFNQVNHSWPVVYYHVLQGLINYSSEIDTTSDQQKK